MSTKILIPQQVGYIEPVVEFVSLVTHAANREPFLILKSDKGEDMKKSIISVLVPKTLNSASRMVTLEGYNDAEEVQYDTYTKYVQIADGMYDENSIEMVMLDKAAGVVGVVANLKEANSEIATTDVEKAKLDYMTMDSVYSEIIALSDIVFGVLNQEHAEPTFKSTVILGAISNTATLLKQIFDNIPADIQKKACMITKNEPAIIDTIVPEVAETLSESLEVDSNSDIKNEIKGLATKLMDSIMAMKSELTSKIDIVSVEVEAIKTKTTETLTKSSELECTVKKQEELIGNLTSQPKTKSDHRYFDDLIYTHDKSTVKNEAELFKGILFR